MVRTSWLGAIAVASLMLTGCAASAAAPPQSAVSEAPHTMPDGTAMPGSEHAAHGAGDQGAHGPSEAALMVCDGQVVHAVAAILGLEEAAVPTSSWDAPTFACTYDVDGAPLVLSVHDAADAAVGEQHFAELQRSFGDAEEIEGLLGLGMPAFTTGDGIVAFLRDGKTLLVDATALPSGLADGTRTRGEAAYALASAVLVCWVEHD